MKRAYVDTTVLANALLKPGAESAAAKAALREFDRTELPVYAIKEFKAGVFKNWLWIYNKLATTRSLDAILAALHGSSLSPKKYRTATALEALRYAKRTAKEQVIGDLREKYGDAGDLDAALVDSWRLSMRTRIELAWRQRRKLTTDVVQPLSCFREGDLVEKRGQLEVGPATCLVDPECCLASELRRNPEHLEKLLACVQAQESKTENERRAKVLKELRWKPRQRMTDNTKGC